MYTVTVIHTCVIRVGSGKEASNITSTAHHCCYYVWVSTSTKYTQVHIRHLYYCLVQWYEVRTNVLTPITPFVGAVSYYKAILSWKQRDGINNNWFWNVSSHHEHFNMVYRYSQSQCSFLDATLMENDKYAVILVSWVLLWEKSCNICIHAC